MCVFLCVELCLILVKWKTYVFVCVCKYLYTYIYIYTVHNVVSNGIELTTKWIWWSTSLPKPTIIIYIYKLVGHWSNNHGVYVCIYIHIIYIYTIYIYIFNIYIIFTYIYIHIHLSTVYIGSDDNDGWRLLVEVLVGTSTNIVWYVLDIEYHRMGMEWSSMIIYVYWLYKGFSQLISSYWYSGYVWYVFSWV